MAARGPFEGAVTPVSDLRSLRPPGSQDDAGNQLRRKWVCICIGSIARPLAVFARRR
jgi:hypothetical protein